MTREKDRGALIYAGHALQPNNLGYCGPDENGTILEALREGSANPKLLSTLGKFEAAYPFVRMIAKSTGLHPFDQKVTEAYWIGNSLLESVDPADFYHFTHDVLAPSRRRAGRKGGMPPAESRSRFKRIGPWARPHHTFYVMALHDRSQGSPAAERKVLELVDSCRVSWGKVVEVRSSTLVVDRPPLDAKDGVIGLGAPVRTEVRYDPRIPQFSAVAPGDRVSLHWNFASGMLTRSQLTNLKKYTALAVDVANSQEKRGREGAGD